MVDVPELDDVADARADVGGGEGAARGDVDFGDGEAEVAELGGLGVMDEALVAFGDQAAALAHLRLGLPAVGGDEGAVHVDEVRHNVVTGLGEAEDGAAGGRGVEVVQAVQPRGGGRRAGGDGATEVELVASGRGKAARV